MSPVRKPRVDPARATIRVSHRPDRARLRQVAEILLDIIDNASTPGDEKR